MSFLLFHSPPSLGDLLLRGDFPSVGTHIDCSFNQLVKGPLKAAIRVKLSAFVTNMPHTPIMLHSSLPWAGEPKLLLCKCLGLLLFPPHSLSCSLPVNFAQKASSPSLLDSFCCCQLPAFHSCATLQCVVLQHVLGAFSPHSISCVYLKMGGFNY